MKISQGIEIEILELKTNKEFKKAFANASKLLDELRIVYKQLAQLSGGSNTITSWANLSSKGKARNEAI